MFEIIAEPNRRAILSLLASSQQSVGEIARQLRMPPRPHGSITMNEKEDKEKTTRPKPRT